MISTTAQRLWARPLTLGEIQRQFLGGCDRRLGVELTGIGPDWLEGRVPATRSARDPQGDNHGGAIAILAESLGSIAANLCLADDRRGVGQSLEIHHFLPFVSGPIMGRASPVSIVGRTHLWRVDLRDEADTLVSSASLQIAILGPLRADGSTESP